MSSVAASDAKYTHVVLVVAGLAVVLITAIALWKGALYVRNNQPYWYDTRFMGLKLSKELYLEAVVLVVVLAILALAIRFLPRRATLPTPAPYDG